MIEPSHQLYFIHQGFLPLVLAVSGFFGKRFDCKFLLVFKADGKVNARKVPLPNLLDWLEQLVETPLVQPRSQDFPPFTHHIWVRVEQKAHFIASLELDSFHSWTLVLG